MKISQEEAIELFDYDAGLLIWRDRPFTAFKNSMAAGRFKSSFAGRPAGSIRKDGYRVLSYKDRDYLVHRVVWLFFHGYVPKVLDHINHDRSDNRIENLREVTYSQNCRNSILPSHNTSGASGVYWKKSDKCWCAQITDGQKTKYLGRFDSFEKAVAARILANKEMGYHQNHGMDFPGYQRT